MRAIDFSRSYMRWFGEPNNVRVLIDAACTLVDDETGKSETYYLIVPCRGEYTHADGDLIQMPSFEFCGIWGPEDKRYLRFAWSSDRDHHTYGDKTDTLEIRRFEKTRSLEDAESVFRTTVESSEPLVSRTTIRDERLRLTAVLEYPVNTMNVKDNPMSFQVDTGPMLLPNFNIAPARAVEGLHVAYVVYNRFDEAEFTLRRPVPIMEGDRTLFFRTDYSELRSYPARNELLLAETG